MSRPFSVRPGASLPLVLAAGLALAAGACAASGGKPPSGDGAGAAAGGRSAGSGGETARGAAPWWRKYVRPAEELVRPGDIPPDRPGLFSGKDGEFVLYRKGEADSSAPTKPTKVRR